MKFFTISPESSAAPIYRPINVNAVKPTNSRKDYPENNFRPLLPPVFLTLPPSPTILLSEEKDGIAT